MNKGWEDDENDDDDLNVDDLLEDWGEEEEDAVTTSHPNTTTTNPTTVDHILMDAYDPAATDEPQPHGVQEEIGGEEKEIERGGGWDDDDDLDLSFSEHNNHNNDTLLTVNVAAAAAAAPPPPPPPPRSAATAAATAYSSAQAEAAAATVQQSPVAEGWGDDEDDLEFSEHSNNNNSSSNLMMNPNRVLLMEDEPADTPKATAVAAPADDAGWNDDLDGFDFSETSATTAREEEALFADNETNPSSAPTTTTPAQQRWTNELTHYLETLPAHAQSITAVLQAEYNTHAKAVELQQYYQERPQLLDYTVEKELARLEYTLITPTGDIVTDQTEMAHHLYQTVAASSSQQSHQQLLTPRCANQSLLADIVQVLTGPDRLVRPQYLTAAVASQCKLRIDLAQHVVEIVAVLDLSLPTTTTTTTTTPTNTSSTPTTTTGRWKIAELPVVIVFVCPPVQQPPDNREPFVEYRLAELRPMVTCTDPDFQQHLRSTVAFLTEAWESDDRMELQRQQQPQQPHINFRDAYLQQSRRLQQDAVDGLKSAWQDLNTATGLGDKFRRLPSFLPVQDVLEAAALAQEQHHAILLQQQQRPTSILGGFVRSLAKSVALPDEDPNLYQEWNKNIKNDNQRRQPPPGAPKLYNTSMPVSTAVSPPRTTTTTTTVPHLYRRDDDPADVGHPPPTSLPQRIIPKLYNRDDPPQSHVMTIPHLYNRHDSPTQQQQQEHQPEPIIPRLYHRETPHQLSLPQAKPTMKDAGSSLLPHVYNDTTNISNNRPEEMDEMETPQNDDDGWGDDDVDLDLEDDASFNVAVPSTTAAVDTTTTAAAAVVVVDPDRRWRNSDDNDWTYDPTTDVIPTRRRWINPVPGRLRVLQFQ